MLKNAAIVAAIIGALGAILVPVVTRLVSQKSPSTPAYKTAPSSPSSLQIPAHKKSPTASKAIVQSGDDDTFDDHSNNSGQQVGSITGSNNQVNQVYGSNGVTINQLPPASSHPVTNDMGLK